LQVKTRDHRSAEVKETTHSGFTGHFTARFIRQDPMIQMCV